MNNLREQYDFLFDGSGDLTQETLLLYVFGPLENEARQAVELHLADCEMCRDAAEGIALLGTKEQALAALAIADAKLMERVEALKQKVTRDGKEALINQPTANEPAMARKAQRSIGWYRYAAAASLVLVVGAAFWLFNQTMQNQAEGIAMGKEDSLGLFRNGDQMRQKEVLDEEEMTILPSSDSIDTMEGGTTTTTPTGGTTPMTNKWTSGSSSNKELDAASTGLGAGTYNVTVTDANCCEDKKREDTSVVAQKPSANAPAKDMPMPVADEESEYDMVDAVARGENSADKSKFKSRQSDSKKVAADTVVLAGNDIVSSSASAPVAPISVDKGTSNANFSVSNAANMTLTDASVMQAQYPGGMAEVQKYFDKLVYPVGTPKGYKGVITFEIAFDKKGKMTKSTIVQSVGEPLDTLLYMHLKKMPNWEVPQPYGEPIESVRLVTVEVTVR